MRSHEETHSHNFQQHFHGVDYQKDLVDLVGVLGDRVDFVVHGQEEAVADDHDQYHSVKPWVDSYQLDDFVADRISHGQTAQRYGGVVLLHLGVGVVHIDALDLWQRLLHGLETLVAKVTKRKTSNVLDFLHLLLQPLSVKLLPLLWVTEVVLEFFFVDGV